MAEKLKIFVVDDDRSICKLLDSFLGMESYPHKMVSNMADAKRVIESEPDRKSTRLNSSH